LDFKHNATTTRVFAGAMGDVEVEVTPPDAEPKTVTVRVDCNVIG
jgi:hypothetical protein